MSTKQHALNLIQGMYAGIVILLQAFFFLVVVAFPIFAFVPGSTANPTVDTFLYVLFLSTHLLLTYRILARHSSWDVRSYLFYFAGLLLWNTSFDIATEMLPFEGSGESTISLPLSSTQEYTLAYSIMVLSAYVAYKRGHRSRI